MRRKRFQKGSIGQRKHGRHRVWVAQWWEGATHRSETLGRCSEVSRGEAEAMLAEILRPVNRGLLDAPRPVYRFEPFVKEVYLPFCRRAWKPGSTAVTSEQIINTHLIPAFGKELLRAVTREQMQIFLDGKAQTHGRSVVAHSRWFLNAIFKLAQGDGLVDRNPAAELRIPRQCQPGRQLRPLTEAESALYLSVLGPREQVFARLLIYEGLRPGEALACRWTHVSELERRLRIEQRIYRGNFDSPKNNKVRDCGLSPGTAAALMAWRELCPGWRAEYFVFASENPERPISQDNLWRRTIRPQLEKVGLEWATFQVLRRTNASLSHLAGVDKKVAADQRGHGIGVSLDVYTTSDIEQKRQAVKKLESVVIRRQRQRLSA